MKRIIAGKIYDTEKATKVASSKEIDLGCSCEESLYRTEKGNWFLVIVNPAEKRERFKVSIYAQTPSQALEWMETAMMTAEIEENFSKYIEEA